MKVHCLVQRIQLRMVLKIKKKMRYSLCDPHAITPFSFGAKAFVSGHLVCIPVTINGRRSASALYRKRAIRSNCALSQYAFEGMLVCAHDYVKAIVCSHLISFLAFSFCGRERLSSWSLKSEKLLVREVV
jgi:hypothetical protein